MYFFYQQTEKDIKKTIIFTIASKRIKYLGINLAKELKDLHIENYKILMKEIKQEIDTEKYISWLWIRIINILQMPILLKAIYRFHAITIKSLIAIFHTIVKSIPKIHVEPLSSQAKLEKEE